MSRIAKSGSLLVAFALASLAAPVLEAQQPGNTAPIPVQIITAKKVFISNAGQETVVNAGQGGVVGITGEPDRTYNQFYVAVRNWGQYELVSKPADADLVFEISFAFPSEGPRFRLLILDARTHFTLWTFTQHVEWALRAGNRDRNFDQEMTALVNNLKKLAGPSPATADSARN
jgi:hypothetical protein